MAQEDVAQEDMAQENMAQENKNLLSNLILISKVDALLAGALGEKKKLETELHDKRNALKKGESDFQLRSKALDEKKNRYQKEEKGLREEQQKLIDRRKSLTTLGNYKLQQAAEREIEHASKQLGTREESLVLMLEEIEKLQAEVQKYEEQNKSIREDYTKREKESHDIFTRVEERLKQYSAEREELTKNVDAASLTYYGRIKDRYPMDAVVKVANNTCSGCFMQVGPQVTVTILRGDSLVRCPGCGRILYHEEVPGKEGKQQK